MAESKVDAVPKVVANVMEGHAEGGGASTVAECESFETLSGVVTKVDEIAVFFGESIEAHTKGLEAGFGFFGREFFRGIGEGFGEFVAEDEWVVDSNFSPLFENGEAGDGEGPRCEVCAVAEVGSLLPKGEICFLKNIIHARISGHT